MANEQNDKVSKYNEALKYSGIGFQVFGVMGAGIFLGYKVDQWTHMTKPYFTMAFGLVFAFAGLYLGLRGFMRDMKK